MTSISKEQCVEFAQLDELYLHHWRLLTGITSSKDESFIYSKEGIFLAQYTDEELSKLTPCEQFEIGEFCATEPLLFPCRPSKLLHFIDNLVLGDFNVPDDFREAVGMTPAVKSNTLRPDAWKKWLDKPRVRLWEAVALSMGIDPGQVSREAGAGWSGWEVGVETSNLATDAAEFCSRLKQACSHADANGGTLKLHPPLKPAWGEVITDDLVNHAVGLADFSRWAKLMGWNLPGDLLEVGEKQKADAEFTGTFAEVVSNGQAIDWRYWMSMKTLTASQSSRLMVGLDPDIFTSLDHNGPARDDTSGLRDRARKIERLALNHGMAEGTALEWLSWAKCNGFSIHRLFVVEVESKVAPAQIGVEQTPLVTESEAPDSVEHKAHVTAPARPLPAQRFQENEILRVIAELGHDPIALPKDQNGKPGIKAKVRSKLNFTPTVFNKAWERLSSTKEIIKPK